MERSSQLKIPNVVAIAGVDPSGGAGLLADVKTISALGGYACGIVTALTAQSTSEVTGVQNVPPGFIEQQMETLFRDVDICAAKIGMLSTPDTVKAVACGLGRQHLPTVVLDPVITAKSGAVLLEPEAVESLKKDLLPVCTILTPNIPEALVLLGQSPEQEVLPGDMPAIARELWQLLGAGQAVYLKGGHLTGDQMVDVIYDGKELHELKSIRFQTPNTHGTGCTLSSAIAVLMPQCETPWEAFIKAHDYLQQAIRCSGNLSVGKGHGPVDHFWMERGE